jgi:Protein of unknown function (DUF1573)
MMKLEPQVGDPGPSRFATTSRSFFVRTLSLTLIILGIIAAFGYSRFGSLKGAVAALGGDPLVVDDPVKSMSGIRPGDRVTLRYALTNLSRHPIRLLGVSTSCSCTVVNDIPMVLAASETRSVTAAITTSERQSAVNGSIRLYTDDLRCAEIVVRYTLHFAAR